MFGGPFFEGLDKILLHGEDRKLWVIFLKFVLKLLIYEKLHRKFQKNANFHEPFHFLRALSGK